VPDARARTPKPVARPGGIDGIRLTPTDGFVLSRVDGVTAERDIVATTGLPGDEVEASLRKLESLGLIMYGAPAPERDATPNPRGTAPERAEPATGQVLSPDEQAAMAEDVDVDNDMRRRILGLYAQLERLDHYALLGVEADAEKKQIKRAYFDLAAKFHPDRYFRKRLGSFKPKMEILFGRITLAHDALTDKARRAEYDAYLEEQRRARGIEELLADALEEIRRAEANAERAAQAASPTADSLATTPPSASPPIRAPGTEDARPASPNVSVSARRDALARRLLGGRGPTPSAAAAPVSGTPALPAMPTATDAVEALRRRYEDRRGRARAAQARKYVADGESALAAGDAVSAANAFRVAATLSPDDPAIAELARSAQARADTILADTYTRQAEYEEKNGQWSEAARSWSRVCRTRASDAHAHERAANALAKSDGDLHEASRLAQHACSLEPASARHRVTLASVYLAAGLSLNARRELETAAQLAPHDGTIPEMLKRLSTSA
jgi:curved DNA-binding protein CbpA